MSKRGNGEGSVCRRPDGRWQGSITIGRDDRGRLIRKYFYGKTRKETSEKLNRAIEELRDNRFINKSDNPTVEQWCHEWLWSYKRNSVKQKTFDQYETILRTHIIPDIGDIRLADLKTMHIQRIINKMHDSGLSHRTIEVMKIGKQWKKYHIDLMNVENIALQKIRDQVQKLISEKSFDSSKEYIKYVYSVINEQSDVKILSKEYVYAIIVKELFS